MHGIQGGEHSYPKLLKPPLQITTLLRLSVNLTHSHCPVNILSISSTELSIYAEYSAHDNPLA